MTEGITVVDVFRHLGLEPKPKHTWVVGNRVRDLYEQENGRLPTKLLRSKTYSRGSHCFAIYPEEWREKIVSVIREIETEEEAQPGLPFDELML